MNCESVPQQYVLATMETLVREVLGRPANSGEGQLEIKDAEPSIFFLIFFSFLFRFFFPFFRKIFEKFFDTSDARGPRRPAGDQGR